MAVGSKLGPNVRPSGGPILRASLSLSYGLSDLPWDCIRGTPSKDRFGLDSEGLGTAGRLRVAPAGGGNGIAEVNIMVRTFIDGTYRATNLTTESAEYLAKREGLRLA